MAKKRMREVALNILIRIEEHGGFSHLLIDREIKANGISTKDKNLFTEIVYGTLERKLTLDYYLTPFIQKRQKVDSWVLMLLRMSLYQMKFLDKVPPFAVINEAVEIAKKRGHKGIASFVNGVLRSVNRRGVPSPEAILNETERLAITTSHPLWLVERWVEQYGFTVAEAICESHLERSKMTARIQTLKIKQADAIKKLAEEGIEAKPSVVAEQGIVIQSGSILESDLYKTGYLTIQDESSMLVGQLIDVKAGMNVLDACSAPGGKTTHIAELMENKGHIKAYDIHKKKLKLIKEKMALLDLSIIDVASADARHLQDYEQVESFDRILVDAPCSGLGVIRSKPDLKYSKSEEDINRLAHIQQSILQSVAPLLTKDGKLVYSTCTIDKKENEEVIKDFLEKNNQFEIDPSFKKEVPNELIDSVTSYGLQILPQTIDSDGFFISRLRKK